MKRQKKSVLLLLLFAFALAMTTATIAAVPIQPLWQNVEQATARVTHSGTTAQCTARIIGLSGTTRISATMTLERVTDSNVITVRTWTQTTNSSSLVMSESATVTSSGTYRVRVDATVTRNGVAESISVSG
ncbi:MAG: hypothetical protein FWB80_12525 [Defluviitaleaceae bacterium]|nr:hypothetical protein [Defluviitaleaceae bacterium]